MKKLTVVLSLFTMLLAQTACTQNQLNEVLGDLQVGVDAASVAAPLVLAAFAPALAAPITAYLGLADQVFADVARIAASDIAAGQKATTIADEIATLAAQNPAQFLPPNSPPQLVAELGAVANAAKAVAGLFPKATVSLTAKSKATPPVKFKLSSSAAQKLAHIQVQAQANLAALAVAIK